MRHVILIEIQKYSGELLRVLGLLASRGVEVVSISVTDGLTPNTSRILIEGEATDKAVARILQVLAVQVRVLKVELVNAERHVERELALITVEAPPGPARQEVISLANIFRAEIIDASANNIILQVAGEPSKIDSLIDLLRPIGIADLARTGRVAVERALTRAMMQHTSAESALDVAAE